MNAHQRRKYRRSLPAVDIGCGFQGYSGTASYPDLMCTDGRMSDMDDDGDEPSTWRAPCPKCNPDEYREHLKELNDE